MGGSSTSTCKLVRESTGIRREGSDGLTAVGVAESVSLPRVEVLTILGSCLVSEGNRFWSDACVSQLIRLIWFATYPFRGVGHRHGWISNHEIQVLNSHCRVQYSTPVLERFLDNYAVKTRIV